MKLPAQAAAARGRAGARGCCERKQITRQSRSRSRDCVAAMPVTRGHKGGKFARRRPFTRHLAFTALTRLYSKNCHYAARPGRDAPAPPPPSPLFTPRYFGVRIIDNFVSIVSYRFATVHSQNEIIAQVVRILLQKSIFVNLYMQNLTDNYPG
ncbi:hypothetical protein EVAR_62804_1 [Eumeta japonica]|uniref:Uncharacterized protein n=1 Tax=Eumeta variegata TaxID=151549 RepID=A0A4C1ZQE8_EUMVA|nr:hypothetical protein EVAR_62804_1 [Eumeta japonica]